MKTFKRGFAFLSTKALAVLAAAFGSLLQVKSEAQIQPVTPSSDATRINYEQFQKKTLTPKLVLKLNVNNPDNSLLAFHRSHSSHSSHRSHSSHSSHSSHYSGSSSGSYTPSYSPPPSYTPSRSLPVYTAPKNTNTSTGNSIYGTFDGTSTSDYYLLGSRVMYKGCKGTDVKELQRLLVALKYTLIITGYFGDQTEIAVIKFQKANELSPDGKVDSQTLQMIQDKSNGK